MSGQRGNMDAEEDQRQERYEAQVLRDWRFQQCFEALVLSPSYRLAHEIALGAVRRPSRGLPRDFGLVEKTYKAFGPVHGRTFPEWWRDDGRFVFGVAIEPELEVFTSLRYSEHPTGEDVEALFDRIDQYLVIDRPSLGSLTTLVMAVPIHPNKRALMKAFGQLISAAYERKEQPQRLAPHSMPRNKIREATVVQALRTARERVAHPDEPLWRIGNRARVSALRATALKANAADPTVSYNRRIMAILTSREIQRAYRLIEHAARGRFPCLDPLTRDPNRFLLVAS
jgi:hypothetical protein